MSKLKLLKLMYLAERRSLKHRGLPMICDRIVCMKHGPVLSETYNMIDYLSQKPGDRWQLTRPQHGRTVSLKSDKAQLDHLSKNDLRTIERVWGRFGHMSPWMLSRYTHTLPEYSNPGDSATSLSYLTILQALGVNGAKFLAGEIEFQMALDDDIEKYELERHRELSAV